MRSCLHYLISLPGIAQRQVLPNVFERQRTQVIYDILCFLMENWWLRKIQRRDFDTRKLQNKIFYLYSTRFKNEHLM